MHRFGEGWVEIADEFCKFWESQTKKQPYKAPKDTGDTQRTVQRGPNGGVTAQRRKHRLVLVVPAPSVPRFQVPMQI